MPSGTSRMTAYASHTLATPPLQSYHDSHAVSTEQEETEGRDSEPPLESDLQKEAVEVGIKNTFPPQFYNKW